ncbi:MAG: hypothetical protein ANABAC_3008 [Anaerolineae bacterium]|nr:MAG: hypothetical protein ANABAC_3008 [Anaerolineae bacterium]
MDLIARSGVFWGMTVALELLERALPHLQVERLVTYALRYEEGATIKRLGWVLEQMGIAQQHLEPLQSYWVITYYRLDPQKPPGNQYNARWRVIENLHVDLVANA